MTRSVLVTGGAGFIGSNLVRRLGIDGYHVIVLDNFTIGDRQNLKGLPVEVQERDIATVGDWMPNGLWAVVHLAAHTNVMRSVQDPWDDFRLNAEGTLTVLKAARDRKVERFVLASSNAVLGHQTGAMRETMVPAPLSPYGASKLAAEGYCLAFHASYGLSTTVLRFANAYGPYSRHKTSVVTRFLTAIMAGEPVTIYGDGMQGRDFIHVDDVCSSVIRALEAGEHAAGEVFQIGTGKETSIRDLCVTLGQAAGRDVKIEYQPARRGEIPRSYSDISKARATLGFVPQVALEHGLRGTLNWLVNHSHA